MHGLQVKRNMELRRGVKRKRLSGGDAETKNELNQSLTSSHQPGGVIARGANRVYNSGSTPVRRALAYDWRVKSTTGHENCADLQSAGRYRRREPVAAGTTEHVVKRHEALNRDRRMNGDCPQPPASHASPDGVDIVRPNLFVRSNKRRNPVCLRLSDDHPVERIASPSLAHRNKSNL